MKKILLFFITICISATSFGQVGYMGKRFLINADAWGSPCWFVANSNGNKGMLKFNYFLEPGIEFVISKKMSIGATYLNTRESKFPVGFYAEGGQIEYMEFKNNVLYHNTHYDVYLDRKSYDNTFKTHGMGIFYKYYFSRKSFAPMGYFVKAELNYFFYKYKTGEINFNKYIELPNNYWDFSYAFPDGQRGINNVLYEKTTGKGSVGGLKLEIGRDFLFFNRLRLSTGIGFGVTFGGYKTNPFNNNNKYVFAFCADESYKQNIVKPTEFINGQLLGTYWFGLRMGIGFLAF